MVIVCLSDFKRTSWLGREGSSLDKFLARTFRRYDTIRTYLTEHRSSLLLGGKKLAAHHYFSAIPPFKNGIVGPIRDFSLITITVRIHHHVHQTKRISKCHRGHDRWCH